MNPSNLTRKTTSLKGELPERVAVASNLHVHQYDDRGYPKKMAHPALPWVEIQPTTGEEDRFLEVLALRCVTTFCTFVSGNSASR
jgi:hypothetical protein